MKPFDQTTYRLDMLEVLKDTGKYENNPLEKLTIKNEGTVAKLFDCEQISITCEVEDVWFGKSMFELYKIIKIHSKSFITDAEYIFVNVWDEGKLVFLNKDQAKYISRMSGCYLCQPHLTEWLHP